MDMDVRYVLNATDLSVQVRNAGAIATRWKGYTDRTVVVP